MAETLTFKEMVALEPELKTLFHDAAAITDDDPEFCANETWYREFKGRILSLVGHGAVVPELRWPAAYDLATQTLYDLLPGCRENCGCLEVQEEEHE